MRWTKLVLSLTFTVLLVIALLRPISPATFPLGSFFSPMEGFWKNAPLATSPASIELTSDYLKAPVEVVYDERQVPHIFAQNEEDLYFAQGYVTARDRLWQMEFQTMAAAGRLTEILPASLTEQVLPVDRDARRKGMTFAAEQSCEAVMANDATRRVQEAYSAGINTYIDELSSRTMPLEYKILNYEPEAWTPYKTCLLLKYMANMLASRQDDLEYTRALHTWGRELFDTLFPERYPIQDPIIPIPTPLDYIPDTVPTPPLDYRADSLYTLVEELNRPYRNLGSNNWAIAGSKSITGSPILASDPHLGLNLPSIWYEIQLHMPGSNAYGASLPGSPCVVIGFNDSIAWGQTNAGRDVLDYYRVTYKDDSKIQYAYDGGWREITPRIEEFKLKGGSVFYDTVKYTHFGPIRYDEDFGNQPDPLAIRWMAFEAGNELLTLINLNKANNYDEYLAALQTYTCPAQNFVFASRSGDIAIWQQGKFVNRWKEQGKYILDASRPDHHWQGFIPSAHNPHVKNPPRGFVSSANQHPVSDAYPYYYSGGFEDFRNRRLNKLLSERDSLTIDDMKRFQLDTYSVIAEETLPILLSNLETASLTGQELQAFNTLRSWDYFYDIQSTAPSIFEAWWDTLYEKMWRDDLEAAQGALPEPDESTTITVLQQYPDFKLYDDLRTPETEDRKQIINQTFRGAIAQLVQFSDTPSEWNWRNYKNSEIRHLIQEKSFSHDMIPNGGNRHILNAHSKYHGPSWRMIVSLGKEEIEAYGVYPGGQSGNPGSAHYDEFITPWAEGHYFPLWFMSGKEDNRMEVAYRLKIETE